MSSSYFKIHSLPQNWQVLGQNCNIRIIALSHAPLRFSVSQRTAGSLSLQTKKNDALFFLSGHKTDLPWATT